MGSKGKIKNEIKKKRDLMFGSLAPKHGPLK